jgi:hypothetical protein
VFCPPVYRPHPRFPLKRAWYENVIPTGFHSDTDALLRRPDCSVPRRFASCSAADCQYFHVLAFAACGSPCPRPARRIKTSVAGVTLTVALRNPATRVCSAAAQPLLPCSVVRPVRRDVESRRKRTRPHPHGLRGTPRFAALPATRVCFAHGPADTSCVGVRDDVAHPPLSHPCGKLRSNRAPPITPTLETEACRRQADS